MEQIVWEGTALELSKMIRWNYEGDGRYPMRIVQLSPTKYRIEGHDEKGNWVRVADLKLSF